MLPHDTDFAHYSARYEYHTALPKPNHRLPFALFFGALFLFFWRYGYGYASGDQDELLPYLWHLLNPDILAQDWFVQTQSGAFGVRTYFVWLLRGLCVVLPPWLAILGLYIGCWIGIAAGVYRLALTLVPDRLAAAGSVIVALAITHKWTLGSNDLVYAMLVPEMISWVLALFAVVWFLETRWMWAGVALGVAAWFQVLVGLHTGGVLGLVMLWMALRQVEGVTWKQVLLFGLIFVGCALPTLIPLGLQQLEATQLVAEPSIFYIVGPFRNPFHYMLSGFSTGTMIRFAVLMLLGTVAFYRLHRSGVVQHAGMLLCLVVVMLLLCLVAAISTDVYPILFLAKFQFFKLTVWLKLLVVICLCAGVVRYGLARWQLWIERGMDHTAFAAVVALAWIGVGVSIFFQIGRPAERVSSFVHAQTDLGRIEQWIRHETSRDAVFAIPPSISSFRTNTHRAIVVNYAAYPYRDHDMQAWYRRLITIAPIEPPPLGLGLKPMLDAAFHMQSAEDWQQVKVLYQITHLLVNERARPEPLPFERLHTQGPWVVYRIPEAEP